MARQEGRRSLKRKTVIRRWIEAVRWEQITLRHRDSRIRPLRGSEDESRIRVLRRSGRERCTFVPVAGLEVTFLLSAFPRQQRGFFRTQSYHEVS